MFDPTKIISQLKDLGSVPTKVILFVSLSSGALLVAPTAFLSTLRLEKFMADHGHWVGIAWLLSSIFLAITLAYAGHEKWQRRIWRLQRQEYANNAIAELADVERAVLREFEIQRQPVVKMPIDNPVVAGLLRSGILERVGELGDQSFVGFVFPLRIADVARHLLTPDLLGLPESPTDHDVKRIVSQRPHFAQAIAWREDLRRGPVGWR